MKATQWPFDVRILTGQISVMHRKTNRRKAKEYSGEQADARIRIIHEIVDESVNTAKAFSERVNGLCTKCNRHIVEDLLAV